MQDITFVKTIFLNSSKSWGTGIIQLWLFQSLAQQQNLQ